MCIRDRDENGVRALRGQGCFPVGVGGCVKDEQVNPVFDAEILEVFQLVGGRFRRVELRA